MQLIPVLDLKNGKIVHAVGGQRARYRPLETVFRIPPTPRAVAELCVRKLGYPRLYVADLGALSGGSIDWAGLQEIAAVGAKLILDVGIANSQQVAELAAWNQTHRCLDGIVIALESTLDASDWSAMVSMAMPSQAVFSLDLRAGKPLTRAESLAEFDPLEIARHAYTAGFRRLIVLDLAAVGTDQGPITLDLCRLLQQQHSWMELITGGAVRHAADLAAVEQAGADAVLVASALYDGRLAMPG